MKSFLSLTLLALLRVIFVLFVRLFSAMELWENIIFAMFLLRRSDFLIWFPYLFFVTIVNCMPFLHNEVDTGQKA